MLTLPFSQIVFNAVCHIYIVNITCRIMCIPEVIPHAGMEWNLSHLYISRFALRNVQMATSRTGQREHES